MTDRPVLSLLDALAEQRIAEAAAQGAFDDLPGAGQPLRLDDDALVPEELRTAWRLLRNSGHLPPELELLREIRSVEQLLAAVGDAPRRERAERRLALLRMKLAESGRGAALLGDYAARVGQRLSRG